MLIKYSLLIIFIFSFSFCKNDKFFKDYNNLIEVYPQFISSNYFEDSNNFYFIKIIDLNNIKHSNKSLAKTFKNEISKARITAIGELMQSICCGFDVSLFNNDSNNPKSSYIFEVDGRMREINDVEVLLEYQSTNKIIYAIKKSKDDLTFIKNCDCNIKTN